MIENFKHILKFPPIAICTSSSSNHIGGKFPFKAQVNFDILVFEGQIYLDALEKWLNLLEGYFSVHINISSLGAAYRYDIKIEHKFRHQNKWEFRSTNPQKLKHGKYDPNQ
jgi:hypothetical protein